MAVKHGYDYEREILDSLVILKQKHQSIWFYKMVDTHSFSKLKSVIQRLIVKYGQREPWLRSVMGIIIPKVPADIDLIIDGRAIKIECKSSKNKTSWSPISAIKDHQFSEGMEIVEAGGEHYFFVCNRSVPRQHKHYIITVNQMDKAIEELYRVGRKSFKWDEWESYASLILEKQKGCVWDLDFLLEGLNGKEENVEIR